MLRCSESPYPFIVQQGTRNSSSKFTQIAQQLNTHNYNNIEHNKKNDHNSKNNDSSNNSIIPGPWEFG
eukprot:5463918-Amphidinium_carterae.1